MRETSFIKQNKEKWKEFESILDTKDKDPDKLNDLFIQITDDLSYSRTFYPNRSVRVYLNNLAQQVFHTIYKNKKSRLGRLANFWTEELPILIYEARPAFRLSFFVFMLAMAIGVLSSAMDPDFPRAILGDAYVDMTIENIESGDPMAVYKDGGQFSSSLGITANNLMVAFLTFVLGVFFIIGSLAILIKNGIMVGAFQYFFYEQELLQESALTIWMHGALEISAIVIAGAAGITLGRGLVFPGTLSRIQAFQLSARRGIKIMIGITPIFLIAGFIEGYLTRYTETPDIIRGLFILSCFAFIIGYFVIYPVVKARQKGDVKKYEGRLSPKKRKKVRTQGVYSSSEIFSDIFVIYHKHFKNIALSSALGALLFCLTFFAFFPVNGEEPLNFFSGMNALAFANLNQFFKMENYTLLLIGLNIGFYALVSYTALRAVKKEALLSNPEGPQREKSLGILPICFLSLFPVLIFTFTNQFAIYIFLGLGPIFLLWMYVAYIENLNVFAAFSKTTVLLLGQYTRVFGLFFLLGILAMVFYTILDTSLLWLYIDIINWNFAFEENVQKRFQSIIATFTSLFMLGLITAMLVKGMALMYYTLLEIQEAPFLNKKIKNIGSSKRIQGLMKEN